VQRRGTVAHRNRVTGARLFGECTLESRDGRPSREPLRSKDGDNGRDIIVIDLLMSVRKALTADRLAAMERDPYPLLRTVLGLRKRSRVS
jgi:hypothetical protein